MVILKYDHYRHHNNIDVNTVKKGAQSRHPTRRHWQSIQEIVCIDRVIHVKILYTGVLKQDIMNVYFFVLYVMNRTFQMDICS
jgi:hypothetical protein